MISNLTRHFSGDNLKARCARSSFVLGIGTAVEKGLAFASKMILAKLLFPEEMGLIVLIISLTALFEALTEVGVKQAVIQSKDGAQSEYLNAAWWFQSLRGISLYIIAFSVAPLLCRFYFTGKPDVLELHTWSELYLLVRLAFLSILFNGLISPRAHVLEKEFRFGKAVLLMQGSAALGAIVTIALAFTLRNAWAMVIGFVSILCPFRPYVRFNPSSFHGLYKFARGVFGSPFLAYIAFNIDVLVAGKIVIPQLLGMYGMALALARIPRELFMRTISPVLFAAFSKKQDDHRTLCTAVLRMTEYTVLLVAPFAAVAVVCSKKILSMVFTEAYSGVAMPFGILCFYILILIQGVVLTTVFLSIGKPGKHRAFVGLRAVLIVLFIVPATKHYGLSGTAAVLLASNFCALYIQLLVIRETVGLKITDYLFACLPGLVFSVPAVGAVWLVRHLAPEKAVLHLVVGILTACMAVVLAYFVIPKNSKLSVHRIRFGQTAAHDMKDDPTKNVK